VLHVGDSINADVGGAHATGIQAAWVNRRGHAVPAGAPVAYEITDLAGLADIIG
jgi:2-haloacid dehalogenase/putative hydrolase of the HAD superfamily